MAPIMQGGAFSRSLLCFPLVMESFFSDNWKRKKDKLLFGRKSLYIFNTPTKYSILNHPPSPPPPTPPPSSLYALNQLMLLTFLLFA